MNFNAFECHVTYFTGGSLFNKSKSFFSITLRFNINLSYVFQSKAYETKFDFNEKDNL